MPFKQRENINYFLNACRKLGMRESDLFNTADLFEKRNMTAVLFSLDTLMRAQGGQKLLTRKESAARKKMTSHRDDGILKNEPETRVTAFNRDFDGDILRKSINSAARKSATRLRKQQNKSVPKSKPKPKLKPKPSSQDIYIAQYDYNEGDTDELRFKEGDEIELVSVEAEGWGIGRDSSGNEGLFPMNYAKKK